MAGAQPIQEVAGRREEAARSEEPFELHDVLTAYRAAVVDAFVGNRPLVRVAARFGRRLAHPPDTELVAAARVATLAAVFGIPAEVHLAAVGAFAVAARGAVGALDRVALTFHTHAAARVRRAVRADLEALATMCVAGREVEATFAAKIEGVWAGSAVGIEATRVGRTRVGSGHARVHSGVEARRRTATCHALCARDGAIARPRTLRALTHLAALGVS